jgi:hypothetical protein
MNLIKLVRKTKRHLDWIIPVALLATFVGCGSRPIPGLVETYPVKGKLSFQGKPPVGAIVVLHPKKDGDRPVRPKGYVQEDGTFELTSFKSGDGAPAGEYVLTAQWSKLETKPNGYAGPGPNLLPKDYADSKKSPVVIRIAEGSNDLNEITIK